MSDAKYFQTTKRGEIHELKEELHQLDKSKQKEAVKKVIAAMTVGKDVSMLFPDVCNCMQTPSLELKKLVYLYLINYAKTQPDLAIMAVNTFVKDTEDSNPLIRALAVRTMGCIRVEQITEYLTSPLSKCLRDDDPYVRKTAAICVCKLYDINPELVQDQGFLDALKGLIADNNPMVVANAVASLAEISEASGIGTLFALAPEALPKLLAALNECSEWGQVFILDAISEYKTAESKEAESICERVAPRLQHANAAVVLSAVKVVLTFLGSVSNEETVKTITKKLAPPLVTLLSSEPEIQYVALRNMQLICQKWNAILTNDTKVFFCKYNDPTYVKMEKVDVMVMLASERNVEQVLLELREYAFAEVDVDFVRKAVRAIGRCALKIDKAAERCVTVLLECIQTKVAYVVQESVVVIKDIFRKYPNQYESVIGTLCENLDSLEEPEAKAALIWIVGQYAERIDNAQELLEAFIEDFGDLDPEVQLQLLTATVKLFLKKPDSAQALVKQILQLATTGSTNPDLRDRGYIYWRLLSSDPERARLVVLADPAQVAYDSQKVDDNLLELLLKQVSSLASVYHKPAETFLVDQGRQAVTRAAASSMSLAKHLGNGEEEEEEFWECTACGMENSIFVQSCSACENARGEAPSKKKEASAEAAGGGGGGGGGGGDMLDLLGGAAGQPAAAPAKAVDDLLDLMGDMGMGGGGAAAPGGGGGDLLGGMGGGGGSAVPKKLLLNAEKGKGMVVEGVLVRSGGRTVYELTVSNQSPAPMAGFAIQVNKNMMGSSNAAPLQVPALQPQQSHSTSLPMAFSPDKLNPTGQPGLLQVAMKNQAGVCYFQDAVGLVPFLIEGGQIESSQYPAMWQAIPPSNQAVAQLSGFPLEVPFVEAALGRGNIAVLHRKKLQSGGDALYCSAKTESGSVLLCEVQVLPTSARCAARCEVAGLAQLMPPAIQTLLTPGA